MISPRQLNSLIGTDRCPLIIDVRRADVFAAAPSRIAGALWRHHMEVDDWQRQLPARRQIVVYCAHGHNVSEIALAKLMAAGADSSMLEGGMDAWLAASGPVVAREAPGLEAGLPRPSVWVTRARPKIDRIACPWLIRRFIDPLAIFQFVSAEWVKDVADETGAIPYDVKDVHYSHRGDECTFDTLISEFGLTDPALLHLARIVRGADTARLDLEPQAAGLLAVSLGLSVLEEDDLRQLEKGMAIYDALYGWCRYATDETHNWPAKVI
ncbi:chromate resistance protein ChrB domain-containing protein [Mesorhizobium sp. ANAO-SY3R2]|uniref:chromate resistance protein ChrB domain-containing protein n=1 Tax=Mesorhizobium sp. ANAO-SY3R2 TaxID=3166644 RepID=UPI00366EC082